MNKSHYINLFANCIPVKGAKNVIVCDLQRGVYFEIDEVLHQILMEHSNKTIEEIIEVYGQQYEDEIINQLEQLLKEDLIHITGEPHLFPELDLAWESPSIITNMIIEYGDYFEEKEEEIVNDLIKLGVQYLELRFYSQVSYEKLCTILQKIRETKIAGVYLVLQNFPCNDIDKFFAVNQRIMHIMLANVADSEYKNYKNYDKISVVKNTIVNNENCGIICHSSFQVNLELFTESQKFNSCLNKKLSLLENGDIKNCPSMPEILGNIYKSGLAEILNLKNDVLHKYWDITKDQIEVCKDCEFRYICTDCRAFRESDSNIYSKPLKCSYDPYKGKWGDNLRNLDI